MDFRKLGILLVAAAAACRAGGERGPERMAGSDAPPTATSGLRRISLLLARPLE
ncbi:MAG: hypothetical protein ACT4PV_11175 [Planctomycetaceae bacterium]